MLPDVAPDLTELHRRLAARRYSDDTLRAVEIDELEILAPMNLRYGGQAVRYGLHAKPTNDDWGRSVTLFVPKDRHALLDAFQIERTTAEPESLREAGYEFVAEQDPSIGERSEIHGIVGAEGRASTVAAVFVRCGVFVNVEIWSVDTDALAVARRVAQEIDGEVREVVCSEVDETGWVTAASAELSPRARRAWSAAPPRPLRGTRSGP